MDRFCAGCAPWGSHLDQGTKAGVLPVALVMGDLLGDRLGESCMTVAFVQGKIAAVLDFLQSKL